MKTNISKLGFYALITFTGICVAMVSACDDPCGRIRQTVEVAEPDADLIALMTDCNEGRVSAQSQCPASQMVLLKEPQIPCACRPLCERMLALVDGFPGPETLKSCVLSTGVRHDNGFRSLDAGLPVGPNAFQVSLTYVPSNCHAPAQ